MSGLLRAALAGTAIAFLLIGGVRAGVIGPFSGAYTFLIREVDFYACLPFAAVLIAALAPPVQRAALALAQACGARPVLVAAITAAVLAFGARVVYHAHPLAMDEYAPYFQSAVFAEGRMSGSYPAALLDWLVPKQFQNVFFRVDRTGGGVISIYWPGMALLLTPFTALGAPWLLNPLIGGATVLVMHRLAMELFRDRLAAGLVVLFTLASPAVTLNAVSFYSMPAHLLLNATFALLLLQGSPARAFLAGIAGSAALVLHNPVPHLLFALPWLAWLAGARERRMQLVALVCGYVPLCVVLGLGWINFARAFGTHADGWQLATRTEPVSLAARLLGNILRMPTALVFEARILGLAKLWVWAAPALLVAAAIGAWRLREDTGRWLVLAGCALITLVAYLFVPHDQGHGWGYRYFHSAWLVLPLFAVAALQARGTLSLAETAAARYLAGCALLGLAVMTPFQAVQVEQFVRRHLEQLPSGGAGEPRVLIIDPRRGFYAADLVENDPFLRGRILKLITLGDEADEAMMAARFPGYVLLHRDGRGSVWGVR